MHEDIPQQQQQQQQQPQQHTHTISLRGLHTSDLTTAILCRLVTKGMKSG